jgi:UDP-glucose 4-epimerase
MGPALVTGGAGFIGSHLAGSLLKQGRPVRILDDLSTGKRANIPAGAEFLQGSIADPAAVAAAISGASAVFHLAAIASVQRTVEDWPGSHAVNLSASIRIFDAAAGSGIPVVYASSAAVYGDPGPGAVSEATPCRPLSPYGADKLGMELHAAAGGTVRGLKSFGLRFFNIYGPRQDPSSPYSGVISIFADRAGAGLPLRLYGGGPQTRDFVHVSDVVEALLLAEAGSSSAAPVANICAGASITIRELALLIRNLSGSASPIEDAPPRAGDIQSSLGDPALAEKRLGWRAKTALRDGLAWLLTPG